MRSVSFGLGIVIVVAVVSCQRTMPPSPIQAALYRDMQRVVTLSETTGWEIDRVELAELESDALMSVCQTPSSERLGVLHWVDSQIEASGGPVEDFFRRKGADAEGYEELLTLTRVRMSLAHTIAQADTDCPFWLSSDPEFAGRQIADDRWYLSFGGGGKATLVWSKQRQDLTASGAGRLLVGRGIGKRLSMFTGLEAGASASFPRDKEGDRGTLVIGIDFVAPVVMRYRWVNTYVEWEAGYLGQVSEDSKTLSSGFHIGVGFGGRTLRQNWFFPGAAFGISYQRAWTPDGPLNTVKFGFRGAVDIDL